MTKKLRFETELAEDLESPGCEAVGVADEGLVGSGVDAEEGGGGESVPGQKRGEHEARGTSPDDEDFVALRG